MVGSTVTYYIWDGSGVVSEHDSTGAMLTEYMYAGKRMIAKFASGAMQYFLNDRLSERVVLDASGNLLGRQGHLAFGEDFGESGTQEKHHLASYERDNETQRDYAVNRQFEQALGRFMRVDPHGPSMKDPLVLGSYGDPQSLNRYNYARNDPINATDPFGLNMCFGYDVFILTFQDGVLIGVKYLGFFPVYCWGGESGDSGGGGGGGGVGSTDPTPPKQLPKAKFSEEKFQDCVRTIFGGDPSTPEGRFINAAIEDILSKRHRVNTSAEAGGYGVYFDFSLSSVGLQNLLKNVGAPGINEPQIAGYSRFFPNIIYFANDVFSSSMFLQGKPGKPQYEYESAVLFHEIGNWISDIIGRERPRQGGPEGDRDAGSNLEQCMYNGFVYKDGRVHKKPR